MHDYPQVLQEALRLFTGGYLHGVAKISKSYQEWKTRQEESKSQVSRAICIPGSINALRIAIEYIYFEGGKTALLVVL